MPRPTAVIFGGDTIIKRRAPVLAYLDHVEAPEHTIRKRSMVGTAEKYSELEIFLYRAIWGCFGHFLKLAPDLFRLNLRDSEGTLLP